LAPQYIMEKIDCAGMTRLSLAVYSGYPEDFASFMNEYIKMMDAFGYDLNTTIKCLPIYLKELAQNV